MRFPRPITVALVDDEPMVRSSLASALADGGLEVVGEAADGSHGIAMVVALAPDVVLMDLKLPGVDGIDVLMQLGLFAPTSRVLILARSDQNRVVEAIVAGARGYILKSAKLGEIVTAVRATAAGESVLSPQIAGKLLERIRERDLPATAASHSAANAIHAVLTPRELDIFALLASGMSNHEIGTELVISTSTTSNHIASILAKLHLENRVQAAVHAVRSGIS